MLLHACVVKWRLTIYTSLGRKAPMSLNDLITWNTCSAFQCINVLCEALMQKAFVCEKLDKRMRKGRPKSSREQLMCEGINWNKMGG